MSRRSTVRPAATPGRGAHRSAAAHGADVRLAVVVPCRDGRRWLPGLLASLRAQTRQPDVLLVVDDASADGSAAWLREQGVDVLVLERNAGFAAAANRGIEAVDADAVALLNTDVVLAPDWLERTAGRLGPGVAAVATKMVSLDAPAILDDCGDVLRRDGVCEQRGHGRRDDGRYDEPGEVFAACAGAALYRREAVLALGGFEESFFAYLEDADLGLRLRLAGWSCAYEPAVARHAGQGSASALPRPVRRLVARNTLLLVARHFPLRWAGPVVYRQLAWLWHAGREGALRDHLLGLADGLRMLPAALRDRHVHADVGRVVPPLPWRGPSAGGHRLHVDHAAAGRASRK
jgi:GT2 family glycosyltransferase